jgi:hypothetical protein
MFIDHAVWLLCNILVDAIAAKEGGPWAYGGAFFVSAFRLYGENRMAYPVVDLK